MMEQVACNLCGADDYRVVYPSRRGDAEAAKMVERSRECGDEVLIDPLVQCNRCGLMYVNPREVQVQTRLSDGNLLSQAPMRERTFARCLDFVEKHAGGRGRILDVGTAGGSFLHVAKERGWDVEGCEPSAYMREWSLGHYGLEIHPGTIFDLAHIPEGRFDVITLWDVLEHVPDPTRVLGECRRLLKPGGLLVVNYPDMGALITRLMGRRFVFLLAVHLYYFSRDTISKLLDRNGFDTVLHRAHLQTLEFGYLLHRARGYMPGIGGLAWKTANALGLSRVPLRYWMGQSVTLARKR